MIPHTDTEFEQELRQLSQRLLTMAERAAAQIARAMRILAMRHPVASDLRFITMSLKFVVDVERIGDLAVGIAKRALELNRLSSLEWRGDLTRLATLVQRNLHLAIESFVHRNIDEA